MCWIGYCPPGVTPDLATLRLANVQNPDGSGWAMRTPNGLEVVRSLDGAYAASSFLRAREAWPEAEAVYHARYGTHGAMDEANVHPFNIPGTSWYMAHNGMLPLSDGPWHQGRSDSRILAEDILSVKTWGELKGDRGRLEKWLQGDKLVILSAEAQKKGPVLIFNERNGSWLGDGVWHSSSLYTYRGYQSTGPVTVVDGVKKSTLVNLTQDPDDDEEAWWKAHAEDEPLGTQKLTEDERLEYLDLLDMHDRGTLSPKGCERLDLLETYMWDAQESPLDSITG